MSAIKTPASKTALKALELDQQGQRAEAIKLFKRALVTSPTDWVALFSLGRIYLAQNQLNDAAKLLHRLVHVQPRYAAGLDLYGVVQERLGQNEAAIQAFQASLALEPGNADSQLRLGGLLFRLRRIQEATACFSRAVELAPQDTMALANLGRALDALKRFEEAGRAYQRLLDIDPHYRFAKGLLAFNQAMQADWQDHAATSGAIVADIRQGVPSCMPLAFMALSHSAQDNLQCAQMYAAHFYPAVARPASPPKPRHDKLRVAYVSGDFREHPVGHLMAGVIEHHDRSRFEWHAISLGAGDHSTLRARFEKGFDHFHEVSARSSHEIVQLMHTLALDIAVDLAGYTDSARPELFANRIAPVQVNFLGFPGSMGVDYMDYIIADRTVIPEADQACYTEKVAYLPHTYLPTDSTLQVAERTPTRQELGLPASGFVFCSFNHVFKITPDLFAAWMQLLRDIPGSVLWLSKPVPEAMRHLQASASQAGVAPDRLVFAERTPLVADHLARYRVADLFLDTSPYNAHTTAADALFVGLPVLTLQGSTFSGRVAASLLGAIGMPELIASDLNDYTTRAKAWATHPAALAALRQQLTHNRRSHPLFDTHGYTQHLEALLQQMVQRRWAGLPPGPLDALPRR